MNPLSLEKTGVTFEIDQLIAHHSQCVTNASRAELIQQALEAKEAILTKSNALATWRPKHATGRIPKDTYMVQYIEDQEVIDWSHPACIPMQSETFDSLLHDAIAVLATKPSLFVHQRTVGHDRSASLGVEVITDSALETLFADTMFCPDADLSQSVLGAERFRLIALPYDALPTEKYRGILREENGKVMPYVLAMDFKRRLGIVYGTSYCGCVKKLIFTAMNYYLPQQGILPLHCSANEDADGNSAIFLGLSGTGKTTLSNVPTRTLIGDDEHAWTDKGVSNLEGGCYAKLIHLREEKEPDIHRVVFGERPLLENGCIIENAVVYPDGTVDVDDDRIAENSRAAYPLDFLRNTKKEAMTSHPKTIIFLTADANGVLPPLAKLDEKQAMLWFLMGYTSKLAGTEMGIIKPVSAFSRFFGGPFMPCHPRYYLDLLQEKIRSFGANVYLINTGWTGGPYGVGKRMDITLTRTLVEAALSGALHNVACRFDERWKLDIPLSCPGVSTALLYPQSTWEDPKAYDKAADALAKEFAAFYEKTYGAQNVDPELRAFCPGI